jgi:hypothetical protein
MTALDLLNIIEPEHGRTSCDDEHLENGFYSRNGETWHGRCRRCMLLEILKDGYTPTDFDPSECEG